MLEQRESETVYENSVFRKQLDARREQGLPTVLLASDIDRTFISNFRETAGEENDNNARAYSARLAGALQKRDVPLAYVTGNGVDNVISRVESGELPLPSIIAGLVGTEIWVLQDTEEVLEDARIVMPPGGEVAFFVHDHKFHDKLKSSGYDRREVANKGVEFVEGFYQQDLNKLGSSEYWNLNFQKPQEEVEYLTDPTLEASQPYKTSFYFFASNLEMVQYAQYEAERHFEQRAVVCEELGYSSKLLPEENYKKYCLDILPVTKADSVNYLGEVGDVDFTVVAVVSGNDAMMLEESGDLAITVGGARAELKDHIQRVFDRNEGAHGRGSFRSTRG